MAFYRRNPRKKVFVKYVAVKRRKRKKSTNRGLLGLNAEIPLLKIKI